MVVRRQLTFTTCPSGMTAKPDSLPQYAIFIHGKPHGGHLLRSRIADCLWRKAPGSWAGPQPDDLGYRFFSFGLHFEYTLAVGTYDGCTFWGNHLKVRLNWLLQWYTS